MEATVFLACAFVGGFCVSLCMSLCVPLWRKRRARKRQSNDELMRAAARALDSDRSEGSADRIVEALRALNRRPEPERTTLGEMVMPWDGSSQPHDIAPGVPALGTGDLSAHTREHDSDRYYEMVGRLHKVMKARSEPPEPEPERRSAWDRICDEDD